MIKYKKISGGIFGEQVRKLSGGKTTYKDISQSIEKQIGIPVVRSLSVLSAFSEIVTEELQEGKSVYIEGIGVLSVGIGLENGKVTARKLTIIPSTEMRKRLQDIRIEEVTK